MGVRNGSRMRCFGRGTRKAEEADLYDFVSENDFDVEVPSK